MENTDTTQFFLSENRVFFARMGGDYEDVVVLAFSLVSTHAPAWGATGG